MGQIILLIILECDVTVLIRSSNYHCFGLAPYVAWRRSSCSSEEVIQDDYIYYILVLIKLADNAWQQLEINYKESYSEMLFASFFVALVGFTSL